MNFIYLFAAIFIGAIVIGVIVAVYQSNNHIKTIEQISKDLNDIDGFNPSNIYVPHDGKSAIAIGDNDKQICFVNNESSFSPTLVSYRDLLSVEIIEDGESITKTSRSSQIGGALLGTVLLGGVGTIIGGLSGNKTTTDKVSSLVLRIVINDTKNPDRYITFLNSESKKSDYGYKIAIENIRKWQSSVNVLIRKADIEDEKNKESSAAAQIYKPSNISDLEKLAELRDKGILTDEEFQSEKMKILNS